MIQVKDKWLEGGEKMRKLRDKLLGWYIALKYRERGATAVEYALMVALIAIAIIVTVMALGTQLNTVFTNIKTALTGVAPK